jgi:putative membrane protein insertion efficiency factor
MTTVRRRLIGWLEGVCAGSRRLVSSLLIGLVVGYQILLSPLLGRTCRFAPTCSAYFRQAVEKYGPFRGTLKGLARIARCHPWHPGGFDPP